MKPDAPVPVPVMRIDPDLPVPRYAYPGDAGADLACGVDIRLEPGRRALVPTGIAVALPEGYAAFVHPRSGLAARTGLTIVNTPGTIDSGYRGEIKVCLLNTDHETAIEIHRGDLIAQLVIQPVVQANFTVVDVLPESVRGEKGYGSSGGTGRL
ncbi:MAG: dUTP diphosphatase [Propionibacteriaceae bacterium]|jgi:dUTP pyrophosphatase|nr:dUTP diphosphatase [Propionibacteriaceae bacterium]